MNKQKFNFLAKQALRLQFFFVRSLFLLITLSPLPYTLYPTPFLYAAITPTINYQGFLVNRNNNLPVDSAQDMKFAIYNVETGGSPVFAETRCNLPVLKGRYEIKIGSTTSGGIPAGIFETYPNLWLEIQVDPDGDCGGAFDIMLPRKRLQAAPYSFNSLFASTASAASSIFKADVITNHPVTANNGITISTNLYIQGGISVETIEPGQKLSINGMVESLSGGFKFPDGSIQTKASAETKWELYQDELYSINLGNVGISTGAPQARLHISSGPGETGDILMVSTGPSKVFSVTGEGKVYANYYYGDGSSMQNVTGVDITKVLRTGDAMTGPLTVSGSSLTIVNNSVGSDAFSLAITTDTNRQVYHLSVST
ncbi:MAG: hypothetical protein HY746_00160, partial [Elusimicrobia bacterium]|nr:hypothetical protein [Elusimicrobiota bacterium]